MKYTLIADRFRHLQLGDKGRVVSSKRYFKGDVIEDLSEEDVLRLTKAGAIVPTDEVEYDLEPEGESENTGDGGEGQEEAPGGSAEPDLYDAMAYSDLQALAKDATGNGGGSKEDLIVRLRQHDADSA